MKLIFSLLSIVLLPSSTLNNGDAILGTWFTEGKKAKIEIYKEGGSYHGKIIWLKEPLNEQGLPKVDIHNTQKDLRTRPIMGINLIKGFSFKGGKWEGGEIYDPENGKTYSCVIKLDGNKLDVRGYVGMTMFGRTVTWIKAVETD